MSFDTMVAGGMAAAAIITLIAFPACWLPRQPRVKRYDSIGTDPADKR